MKIYRVSIIKRADFEVEAENTTEAREIAKAMLHREEDRYLWWSTEIEVEKSNEFSAAQEGSE